jgi:hypothetical protein
MTKALFAGSLVLAALSAQAQTHLDTSGNYGAWQGYASYGAVTCAAPADIAGMGCFSFADQMFLYQSVNGLPTVTIHITGQEGGYSCGRGCSGVNLTDFNKAPKLTIAKPQVDSSGNLVYVPGYCGSTACQVQLWSDTVPPTPAVDAHGQPITFTATKTNVNVNGKIYTITTGWTMNQVMLPTVDANGNQIYYNLEFSGESCSGRTCNIANATRLFVTTTVVYPAPPPPPPPPPGEGGDDS